MVQVWKGIAKPLALAGIALAALTGFFHYTRTGPNEVHAEDEAEAGREVAQIRRGGSGDEGEVTEHDHVK
jgi:formate dehydrogenase iron-sulfur subunit